MTSNCTGCPSATSVNSRQIKQVRLLDRQAIPVELIYGANGIQPNVDTAALAIEKSAAHSGIDKRTSSRSAITFRTGRTAFYEHGDMRLLVKESSPTRRCGPTRVELAAGDAPDVEGPLPVIGARPPRI